MIGVLELQNTGLRNGICVKSIFWSSKKRLEIKLTETQSIPSTESCRCCNPQNLEIRAGRIGPQDLETRMLLQGEGKNMSRRRLLLFLKSFDSYPLPHSSGIRNPKLLHHLDDRVRVHKDAINFCKDVLRRKLVDWETLFQNNLSHPIRNVDLVVTVGGDGTLLQASHFLDDTIPVLGVNSDPTQVEEVEECKDEFDASRSTGYLCGATINNFEQVLDDILEKRVNPSNITRLSVCVNSQMLPTLALNDILIAHPCPAAVSRCSFRLRRNSQSCDSSLVNSRSSGLRVSTAAGSTAAMLSAGGSVMPVLSKDLQYMVREPIPSKAINPSLMHGLIKPNETMEINWFTKDGAVYTDGCHFAHTIRQGDTIQVSSKAPVLKIFLSPHLLLANGLSNL